MRAPARRAVFWMYRPTAPSARAQSIQVIHAAHACAERGHRVTLCVRAASPGVTAADVLDAYGLAPSPGLRLVVTPAGGTASSLRVRWEVARWMAANPGGLVLARAKRDAAAARRWFGQRFRLVLEAHEVDSLRAAERGDDPGPWRQLEARVLAESSGVIANCPGTLEALRVAHPHAAVLADRAVALQNATHPARIRRPTTPGDDIGYVGSLLPEKDVAVLADAAARLGRRVVLVGPPHPSVDALIARGGGYLVREGPLPHRDVPDRLARFRTLVLPLGTGLFGSQLTSPLKLFDYLASGRPIAAADTPAARAAAPPGSVVWWQAGDAGSLATALDRLDRDDALRAATLGAARVRTWAERAAEQDAFLDAVLG
jgi:glycosyltransferase involved in cell wall biosynthesis